MSPQISVVIPTIPPRKKLLKRALQSVNAQRLSAAHIHVVTDDRKQGAAATRQRGLDLVDTEWVAFLDDDDEMKPDHLSTLYALTVHYDADYAFSWFDVIGGYDPFPPEHGTRPWTNERPQHTTITVLVRTEIAQGVGFSWPKKPGTADGQVIGEDWNFTLGCMNVGAKIVRTSKRTWLWHHDSRNTSGLATRW